MRCGIIFLFLFCIATVGLASTFYVPDNFPSIQDAIDVSSNGDTIIVRSGTFVENIDFLGKAIYLMSDCGPEVTIIDGGQLESVVKFQNQEENDSVLDGFSITNGSAYEGGGIYCFGSSPTITNTIVSGNTADCPHTSGGCGGGLCCYSASPLIVNNIIANNKAYKDGGGIWCFKFSSPSIVNNTITDNVAGENYGCGGGIFCNDHSNSLMLNNVITNNLALGGSGGIGCGWYSSATIRNNLISKNVCIDGCGGGIVCGSFSETLVENNIIVGNSATGDWMKGGGLVFNDSKQEIVNNIIANNSANWRGGGMYCTRNLYSNPSTLVKNNTVVNNLAGDSGGGLYVFRSFPEITNSIFWNNSAPTYPELACSSCSPPTTFCDIKGGWPGTGNIDVDPLFVDLAANDFHLTFDSPCRDRGDNSVVAFFEDFEGDPRIAKGVVDIGADELYFHFYHTGNAVPGGTIDFKIIGYPLAPVTLAWGYEILDPPLPSQHGDLHIWPFVWCGFVGNILPDGLLSTPVTVPPNWSSGDFTPMQVLVGPWGGPCSKLTNLATVVVD